MAGGNILAIYDWLRDKKVSKDEIQNFFEVMDISYINIFKDYMENNFYSKEELEEIESSINSNFLEIFQNYCQNNLYDMNFTKNVLKEKIQFLNMPSLKYYIDIVTPANKLNYYDGEQTDITGLSVHKFSKEDDTDLGEINLSDINYTPIVKSKKIKLDIETYPYSYTTAEGQQIADHNGANRKPIKVNNEKSIIIIGENCGGTNYGGNWFYFISISDTRMGSLITCEGVAPKTYSFIMDGSTYYVTIYGTNRSYGGATQVDNFNNFLVIKDIYIANPSNFNFTIYGLQYLRDYLVSLLDNTFNTISIQTYDEDGFLMECSYDVEVEPLILLTYKMTGNALPKGEVSCSSFYNNNYAPWYCFDQLQGRTDQKTWATTQLLPQWIQYKFETPKIVKKVITINKSADTVRPVKYFTLQGSNDGEEYIDIQHCFIAGSDYGYKEINYINNDTAYLYYRLYITSNYSSSGNDNNYGCGFEEIELYGLAEENPSEDPIYLLTPAMTSNTTPSGEVSCSSNYNANYLPYYAFNQVLGSNTQTWATIQALPQWIQYKFDTPKVVTKVATTNRNEGNIRAAKTYILQGSNDGSTYVDIQTCSIQSYAAHYQEIVDIENETAYLYYRLYVTEQYSNTGTGCGFAEIGLYGYDAE